MRQESLTDVHFPFSVDFHVDDITAFATPPKFLFTEILIAIIAAFTYLGRNKSSDHGRSQQRPNNC